MIESDIKPKQRRRARKFALQALYQQQINPGNVSELQQQFVNDNAQTKTDWHLFRQLTSGVCAHRAELDELVSPHLSRGLTEVDPIELTLLRLGAFELQHCPENPCAVVLDEYIELARVFGGTDANRFINGVLDKVAKILRATEVQQSKRNA